MAVIERAPNSTLDAGCIDLSELLARSAPIPCAARKQGFQAIFRRMVLEEIHQHGREDAGVEICGVLVGNIYRDPSGPWLYVEASIRGDAAEGHATQVTFKSETWEHIHREMEQKHETKRIIGWYHTHPGFGIFLSGMDLFIQDNFFNLPWQIAFVYDPIGGDEGSFVWRGATSEREPFVVDESITIEESWSLAKRAERAERGGQTPSANDKQVDHAPLHHADELPPTVQTGGGWVVAAVVLVVAVVLAGLAFAVFGGAR
jgi:proteasome lid subunit RPN8/RPN11